MRRKEEKMKKGMRQSGRGGMNKVESDKEICAALYVRVSTEAQAEEGYSIEAQKERLEAFCVARGIKNYEFYIDGAYSGSNIERPELYRLIEDVKSGKITHVIVYKLDRLSRSQKDTLYLIEDVFNPNSVDFISMEENFDTSSPIGRAMLGILSAFAQLERETIYERTRMGMRERVKKGLWPGGGKVPFGYDYDKKSGTLVKNADADKVRQIYELYLNGYSPQKIADILGLKYEQWVTDILSRPLNAGYISFGGKLYKGVHEPIISEEIFEKTAGIMRMRSKNRRYTAEHLLSGLVYCGECGAKMRYQKWGNAGYKLICYSQQKSKAYLVKDAFCTNLRPWAHEVEGLVLDNLFSMRFTGDNRSDEKSPDLIELHKNRLRDLNVSLKRLYLLYSQSGDEILLESIKEIKENTEKTQAKIKELEKEKKERTTAVSAVKKYKGLKEAWDDMTFKEKRSAVEELIEKVVVTGDNIDIYYRIEM